TGRCPGFRPDRSSPSPRWTVFSALSSFRRSHEHDSDNENDHAYKKEKDSFVQIPKPFGYRSFIRRVGLRQVCEYVPLEELRIPVDEPKQLDWIRWIVVPRHQVGRGQK